MKTTNPSRFITRPAPGKDRAKPGGFTLVEFIGVLAIMAILASTLIPVVINNWQSSELNAETTNLGTMDNALVLGVLRTYQIPGATNWSAALANWLTLPSASIATNAQGYGRVYVYDTNGFGSVTLPYSQTRGLAVLPGNPRLMIISSLNANPPLASGGLSSNAFTAIWNTTSGNAPATWTGWKGSGSQLVIQRINLEPLFHRLVLSAVDTNGFGSFLVQSGTASSPYICVLTNALVNAWYPSGSSVSNLSGAVFAGGTGVNPLPAVNAWYLQGTVIGLYDTNNGPATPNLESKLVVQSDTSYVFEDEAWRGQLTGWGTNGPAGLTMTSLVASASITFAQGFVTTGKSFETCPLNPNDSGGSSRGDSCEALYGGFHTFMMDYNNWCKEGFGIGSDNACIRLLNDDQNSIYNLTQNMSQ